MESVVVFPAPLGPTIPKIEPAVTSRSIPSTATVSPKCFESPWIDSTVSRFCGPRLRGAFRLARRCRLVDFAGSISGGGGGGGGGGASCGGPAVWRLVRSPMRRAVRDFAAAVFVAVDLVAVDFAAGDLAGARLRGDRLHRRRGSGRRGGTGADGLSRVLRAPGPPNNRINFEIIRTGPSRAASRIHYEYSESPYRLPDTPGTVRGPQRGVLTARTP